MSDLVERLRGDKCMVPQNDNTGISIYQTRPLSAEAADTIEQMQGDLEMADREAMQTGQKLLKAQARIAELEWRLEASQAALTEKLDRIAELEGALREIEAFDPDCAQTYIARAALRSDAP